MALVPVILILMLHFSDGEECPSSCLMDSLVLLSKCPWHNIRALTTAENKICPGCYQCTGHSQIQSKEDSEVLVFVKEGVRPVNNQRFMEIVDKLSEGQERLGEALTSIAQGLKHHNHRQRRAIRDPGAPNAQTTSNPQDAACRELMVKMNKNDEETLQKVLMNCPRLDCMERCVTYEDACMLGIDNTVCPDCPVCTDGVRSRDKKSLKPTYNDIKASLLHPVIYNQG